jgi:tyrosyl-tRNA synthetase
MDINKELDIIKRGAEEIIPLEELKNKLKKSHSTGKPLRIKYGIDPTKPDVHLGHLVPVRKMRFFQDLGHTGVLIIGDYTAQIGDPTGKDESREALTYEIVRKNATKYMEQLFTVLDEKKTEVHFQTEWFSKMSMLDTILLLARFTLAQMMAHETFRKRYETGSPLSLREIIYPVLQASDSVAINADVELGGTDQKFNILLGRELQRQMGLEPQVAMLSPILIGTDGINKMGKSLDNYIAVLDPPNEKFGKVMSIPDSIIGNYYEYATNIPVETLAEIKKQLKEGSVNPRDLKVQLAKKIVEIFHSEEDAESCASEFARVFSKKELPEDIPEFTVEKSLLKDGKVWIVKLITEAKLAGTGGEARRLIQQGGVTLDGEKISDVNFEFTPKSGSIIQVGKRRFIKIK